ncbi:hypothetical protein HN419_01995 [Candidatus Woesearchaeota archaeon]|jgi:hypothetical protein|nr:hypothetical protein [Candidatus Woesearchaeota archaeon]MBT3537231.1 hypothetical protein [Candidatus Woesearchaeota archaeon]MBT4696793.1 hypothetical protein [Candidatus Woesearchaeota archaeon]MBT4717737.1 hypothetical protein [Candidatus Woesearchaeota archaeon]MBT7106459.1 hypothetical protein [Candidatus Woesearchaeota archaeon]
MRGKKGTVTRDQVIRWLIGLLFLGLMIWFIYSYLFEKAPDKIDKLEDGALRQGCIEHEGNDLANCRAQCRREGCFCFQENKSNTLLTMQCQFFETSAS